MPLRSDVAREVRSLESFPSETKPIAERLVIPDVGRRVSPRRHVAQFAGVLGGAGLLGIVLGIVTWSAWNPSAATPAAPKDGSLRVDSDPRGAEVLVDGVLHGSTPAAMRLAAGQHRLVVRRDGSEHERTVTITSGSDVVHFVAWQPVPAAVETAAATPPPAEPARPATPESVGWVSIVSPERLDVYEGLRRMGTSQDARITLPAGNHVLELTADQLGFRERHSVRVVEGRRVTLTAELPRVPVFINAVPWADVLVDGTPVGQTPLGTLRQPIGTHQIEFRHPEFGSRRQTVVLSQLEVTRISVDMRKP